MTNETRKQIMYADHDREWAPQKRHVGPWQPDQTKTQGQRLVWAYSRDFSRGYENEETRVDLRWTR